jgi:hypothetical protein
MATDAPPGTFVTGYALTARCYGGWDVFTHDVGNRRAPLCWTLAFVLSRTGCWLQNYEATVGDGAYMHTRRVGVTVLATIDGYIIRLVCSNPALVGAPTTPGDAEQCVLQVRDAHISSRGVTRRRIVPICDDRCNGATDTIASAAHARKCV